MSRRSELQRMAVEDKPDRDRKRVLDLNAQGLYHMRGIAKLTGLSYRQVRGILRGDASGSTNDDS